MSEAKQTSVFQGLSPMQTFFAGTVGGFLVVCTIGFFILLGVFLSGGGQSAGSAGSERVAAQQPSAAPSHGGAAAAEINLPEVTKDDWYKGAKNAKITIVEYSDTGCPFCKRFHNTMNEIIENYGDDVKWVYRHAPLEQLHRKAFREAEATECAGEIGGNEGFWAYTDRLYEITPSNDGLQDSQLFDIAADVGLNADKFATCLESGKHRDKINEQLRGAQVAGLRGTPYSVMVVGDETLPISGAQPYASVEAMIQANL